LSEAWDSRASQLLCLGSGTCVMFAPAGVLLRSL
jgi:hypothetical protein